MRRAVGRGHDQSPGSRLQTTDVKRMYASEKLRRFAAMIIWPLIVIGWVVFTAEVQLGVLLGALALAGALLFCSPMPEMSRMTKLDIGTLCVLVAALVNPALSA